MKRLVVCFDGTWQDLRSSYPTNVAKITQAVEPRDSLGINQVVFYSEGVGAFDNESFGWGVTKNIIGVGGGAFGWGLDSVIQEAYRFLCLNYEPEDQIYVFGFSRGAYSARSLAGMIYNSGLLKREHLRRIPEAYDRYRDRNIKPSDPDSVSFRKKYAQQRTNQDAQTQIDNTQIDITFLGCWDTVGSLGIPNRFPGAESVNSKYKFHDTNINRRIQCARHAVGIDEEREVFYVTPMNRSKEADEQDLKQVWFPGDHGCVGGGTEKHRYLSDAALKWMIDEAAKKGLVLRDESIENGIKINPLIRYEPDTSFLSWFGKKIRMLSDDLEDVKKDHIYATFSDLHESCIERWHASEDIIREWYSLGRYRPAGLKKFEERLANSIKDLRSQVPI